MRLTSLGSGSSGNALLVQSGATSVLIDAGVGIRRLTSGLMAASLANGALSAVLITHEHHDHIRTLPQICRSHDCPLFATAGTMSAISASERERVTKVRADSAFRVGTIEVIAIAVSHDAQEPVGFFVNDGEARAAVFTDLGETTAALAEPIRQADIVVLEANYDEEMLARGRYPSHLKRRIRSRRGHLSNEDCAAFLLQHLAPSARDVWLAHLSANNNSPSLARTTVMSRLGTGVGGVQVRTLPRNGAPVVWDSQEASRRPRQIGLPLV